MGQADIDWTKLDWDKPNYVLAEDHGVEVGLISSARFKYGRPKTGGSKYAHIRWREQDWAHKNNTQLAMELRVPIGVVCNMRCRVGVPVEPGYFFRLHVQPRKVVSEDQIQSARWEVEQDVELARKWGVSRERVRQIRAERNKPVCQFKSHCDSLGGQFERWVWEHRIELEGKHWRDAIRLSPVLLPAHRVKPVLLRIGLNMDFRRAKSEYILLKLPINWALPNLVLIPIWNRHSGFITNGRSKFSFGRAHFDTRFGKIQEHVLNVEFQKLVREEVAKAESLGVVVQKDRLLAMGIKLEDSDPITRADAEAMAKKEGNA